MGDVNEVILVGNLGRNPEPINKNNEVTGAKLLVITKSFGKIGEDGKRNEYSNLHNIKVWNKNYEHCLNELQSGDRVLVKGNLISEIWEDENGNKKYDKSVVASNIDFLKLKKWGNNQ